MGHGKQSIGATTSFASAGSLTAGFEETSLIFAVQAQMLEREIVVGSGEFLVNKVAAVLDGCQYCVWY